MDGRGGKGRGRDGWVGEKGSGVRTWITMHGKRTYLIM